MWPRILRCERWHGALGVMLQATAVEAVVPARLRSGGDSAVVRALQHRTRARATLVRVSVQRSLFSSRAANSWLRPFPRTVQPCCPWPELGLCGVGEGGDANPWPQVPACRFGGWGEEGQAAFWVANAAGEKHHATQGARLCVAA